MNIKFLGHDETHNPSGGLCNEYRIDEIESLDCLIDFYHQKSQEYSNQRILLTLDDVSQACYTSGHARMTYDLADTMVWIYPGYQLNVLMKVSILGI